jgi:predicted RNase H-like HicB family nuclease
MTDEQLDRLLANARPWVDRRGGSWVFDENVGEYPEYLPKAIFDLLRGGNVRFRGTWRTYESERHASQALVRAVDRYRDNRPPTNSGSNFAYEEIVEWSDQDGAFVGHCPGVVGPCCHGPDEADVRRQLHEIVLEWSTEHKEERRGEAMTNDELEKLVASAKPYIDPQGASWVFDPHETQYLECLPKVIYDLLEGGSIRYRRTWKTYATERMALQALRDAAEKHRPGAKLERDFRYEIAGVYTDAMVNGTPVDLVGVIAGSCGWCDPIVGETMTVHFGDKVYEIIRTK